MSREAPCTSESIFCLILTHCKHTGPYYIRPLFIMRAPTHFHLFPLSSTLILSSFPSALRFGPCIHFPYQLQHYALRLHGFTRRTPSPPHCSTLLASSRVIQNHGTPYEVVLCRCPCHSLFLTGLMMMALLRSIRAS